jgi:hypothetical protein
MFNTKDYKCESKQKKLEHANAHEQMDEQMIMYQY